MLLELRRRQLQQCAERVDIEGETHLRQNRRL
jgi:hypothetical protein